MLNEQPIIDRSRFKYKQQNRLIVLQMKAERAQRDLDVEAVEEIIREIDGITMQVVTFVPADWFADGVTMQTPDWLGELPADKVNIIREMMRAQQTTDPKV